MAAEQISFGRFRYTDDDGHFWTVRCDIDWGNNADSGLSAAVDGDPVLQYVSKRFHPRYAILQDTSGSSLRVTRRVCGTVGCTAYSGVNAGGIAHVGDTRYETTVPIPGAATRATYKRIDTWGEKIKKAFAAPRPFNDSTLT
jgi:hypothetical protein